MIEKLKANHFCHFWHKGLIRKSDFMYVVCVHCSASTPLSHNRHSFLSSLICFSLQRCMKWFNMCIVFSSIHPSFVTPFLSFTLVGLGVSSDQVLKFKAVGSHLLLRLTANSRHVAVLHLTGTAAGPRVDTHSQGLIWKTEAEEIASALVIVTADPLLFSVTERFNLIQYRMMGGMNCFMKYA